MYIGPMLGYLERFGWGFVLLGCQASVELGWVQVGFCFCVALGVVRV